MSIPDPRGASISYSYSDAELQDQFPTAPEATADDIAILVVALQQEVLPELLVMQTAALLSKLQEEGLHLLHLTSKIATHSL